MCSEYVPLAPENIREGPNPLFRAPGFVPELAEIRRNCGRARPLIVGTPRKSKTPKLLCSFSQPGEFVPGIPSNGRS